MSIYDRINFDLNRMPEREDVFMPNRPTVTDAPLSNVAQPPVFNQLTPEQQLALQNFQNPSLAQINLGGGLGSFSVPQIPLETILANVPQFNIPTGVDLTNLDPTIFGYRPPAVEPEVETVETGLEDAGVSDEVIDDVSDNTYDLGILDPETGQVYESEEDLPEGVVVGGGDGPAGTVVEGPYVAPPPPSVFSEPSPTIVDGGITTATPVVDDRNLITPNVEVPEGSMTGLGSYFTAPQIDQIVDPGYSRPATTDMDRLLEMQRQTYGNFLYAPTPAPAPAPSPDTGTAPSGGDAGSGYVGTDYTTVPTDTTARDYIDQLYNNPTGIQFGVGDVQNQMSMNPYRFDNIGNYYTVYNPAQDMRGILNNIYSRGYGVMDFPVFSGITSLVPSDARATIGR